MNTDKLIQRKAKPKSTYKVKSEYIPRKVFPFETPVPGGEVILLLVGTSSEVLTSFFDTLEENKKLFKFSFLVNTMTLLQFETNE